MLVLPYFGKDTESLSDHRMLKGISVSMEDKEAEENCVTRSLITSETHQIL